uniref:hypothetical protein n=1 Tax=Paenibacillus sp. KS-LC4 TaxID=2979727 RepID=UPI00403F2B7A
MELIVKIGDIRQFSNADKLACFARITRVHFSLGGPSQWSRKSCTECMTKNKTEYRVATLTERQVN